MAVEPMAEPTGLRERKKQLTRDALVRASLELFISQGYEETTVDEIADAVDVSQRTFFRYFASKEEVAFALEDLVSNRFRALLRDRPAHEVPFEALRNAVLLGWDHIEEALGQIVPAETHIRAYLMIESTPALLAAHLRRSTEMEEQVARLIAEREGLDVDTDPRPRTLVAAFSAVMRVAGQLWSRGDDPSKDALRDLTAGYLLQLGPALAEDWHGGTGA
ncbi:TetR family transcriptional regulator [Streptomyces sp. NPDC005963]|uniref:TetR family transcriptional regulator n=1 Tax=Streptomyces sp. NPDC005963 TaxID=3156721 RepID=UPI0033C9B9F0